MSDFLLQGEYADIIIELLSEPYNVDSIVKIVFNAFCIRNESRFSHRRRKSDFLDIVLENLNTKLLSHPAELKCIFEVLKKMKKCGWVAVEKDKVISLKDFGNSKSENNILASCRGKNPNPIIEINKLDDKAFMEEVLRHV